jgi:hypothetical protein
MRVAEINVHYDVEQLLQNKLVLNILPVISFLHAIRINFLQNPENSNKNAFKTLSIQVN